MLRVLGDRTEGNLALDRFPLAPQPARPTGGNYKEALCSVVGPVCVLEDTSQLYSSSGFQKVKASACAHGLQSGARVSQSH